MATDPTTQNVYITGISSTGDLPDWATEETQQKIISAIHNGSGNIYKATVANANMGANMNALLTQVVMLLKGDKESARKFQSMIQEQTELRKQLAELNDGIDKIATNTDPGNSTTTPTSTKPNKTDANIQRELRQMNKYEEMMLRKELASAKSNTERNHILKDMVKKLDTSNDRLDENKSLLSKLGVTEKAAGGGDVVGNVLALATGPEAAAIWKAATIAYGATQVPFEMMMQQVKDRFEIATELRQSGLLEDMGQSFIDVTKSFSDNSMSVVEATQFVREFSKSVGVMGTGAALKFVNQMAHSTDIMKRYGVNFSQVAKISGTYLDTLERTGMLEQISTSERDRGMKSFMSAVEGVSMTLKTSLEQSAKMISEYLSRDDISAMLMTNSTQLSQEVITQIGAMGKMGPVGEIIAKGAIDPNRFALSPEFQKLNNPALSGVRDIIEQMMSELRSGKGTDELIAQYGKRMADIIQHDPVVGQLVMMDDDVKSIVNGVGVLAQTSQDATKDILIPEADQAERRRQEQARKLSVSYDNLAAMALKNLENSGRMTDILNNQSAILSMQLNAVNNLAKASDQLAGILSFSASANELVMGKSIALLSKASEYLPANDLQVAPGNLDEAANQISTNIHSDLATLDDEISTDPTKGEAVLKAIKDAIPGPSWMGGYDDTLKAITDIKSGVTGLTDANGNAIVVDDKLKNYLDAQAKYYESLTAQQEVSNGLAQLQLNPSEQAYGTMPKEWGQHGIFGEWVDGVDRNILKFKETLKNPEASQEDKSAAKEGLRVLGRKEVTDELSRALKIFSEDNKITDEEAALLAEQARKGMQFTNLSADDMKQVISDMSSNDEFIASAGDNADKIISALHNAIATIPQPSTVEQSAAPRVDQQTATTVTPIENYTPVMNAALLGLKSVLSDGVMTPEELKTIKDSAIRSNITPDQMNTVIEGLKSDADFKQSLGDNFSAVATALDSITTAVSANANTNYSTLMRDAELGIRSAILTALGDGVMTPEELKTIKDAASSSNLPREQMNTVIEGLKSDADLKQSLGDNFSAVATALDTYGSQQATVSENNTTPQDVITVPSSQSFLDVMSSNATTPVTEGVNSELYTKMADLTGGIGDDFNQAAQTQFSDFLVELQRDKQLSNDQMVEKLNEVVTNITKNKPQLEETTGKTDVRLLLGAIQDLIRRLQ